MLNRTLPTTLIQIFCKIIFNSKVIVKSIIDADDNFWRSSQALMGEALSCYMMWEVILVIQEKVFIRTLPTTLVQIFCEIIFDSKVIVKSIVDAYDNFWRSSQALMVEALSCYMMWEVILVIQEKVFIRTLPTTLIRIFCEIIFDSKVIVKSIIDADDNFCRSSQALMDEALSCYMMEEVILVETNGPPITYKSRC